MTEIDSVRAKTLEKSVMKKIMLGLIPFLAVLYMLNLLDRGNVSIAALTMQKDLNFKDTVYGFGAGIFFVGYFLFEVPSNLIMERVGAKRWITRIMISWGVISACMMFVKTPTSFYALRFLLGLAEAGFYPGIILYITYWVPSPIRAQVIGRFLALTTVLGLLGGPLGGALLKLDNFHGLRGWQWLFLLEGVPSILLGFVTLKFLPDSPEKTSWLTAEEKTWIAVEIEKSSGAEDVNHLSLKEILCDRRVIHLCAIFIITATAGNAVGFFGPKLLEARSGGTWSNSFISTIGIIPGIIGAIAIMVAAIHSDRTGNRRWHITLGYLVAALGYLACIYAPTAPWILVALSINSLGERVAAGSYWAQTTNLLGSRAAAGGIAFINSVGNLGGFFGPILMGYSREKTHGGFTLGLSGAFAFMLVAVALSYMLKNKPQPEKDLL